MGPKSKTPISSPAAEETPKKIKATPNVQLLLNNCEPGGVIYSTIHKNSFAETVTTEVLKLTEDEQVSLLKAFNQEDDQADLFIKTSNDHFNRVMDYSTETYDKTYLRKLKRFKTQRDGTNKYQLSKEQLIFEETKLMDYLRIIRDELKVRETTSKKLLWKKFVSTIKETGLKSQINLEDTLGSFEDDDDFAEQHVPAVAVRAGGVFSALVASSSGHSSSSSSSNAAVAVAEEQVL